MSNLNKPLINESEVKTMELEQRITSLEKENADLKRQLEERPKKCLCKCGRSQHYENANFCVNCGLKLSE